MSLFARACTGTLVLVCLMAVGCAGDPTGTILLPAQQTLPDRDPPAAAVRVNVHNDSGYSARVQVDCYIGNVLVHHSEALLEPLASNNPNTSLLLGLEEADRVVITCRIDGPNATALWTDQRTYMMGTDFADLDTVTYAIVYPPPNTPPVAVIVAPASQPSGATVTLDGSGSYDPDGGPITYIWEQLAATPDTTVILSSTTSPVVTFTAPTVARPIYAFTGLGGIGPVTLTFRLTVADQSLSASQQVDILIVPLPVNHPPVANAGNAQLAVVGDTVILDGFYSSDFDKDPLTYHWTQLNSPPDPAVTLLPGESPWEASFVVPDTIASPQTLTFQLIVNDGKVDSVPATVTVDVEPAPPVLMARPSGPFAVAADSMAVLDGDASTGPIVSWHWAQVSGPTVFFSPGPDQSVVTFTAPSTGGMMIFELTVSDGENSNTASISMYGMPLGAFGSPPVAIPAAISQAFGGDTVTLYGSGSFDFDGGPLTYLWRQTVGPAVTLSATNDPDVTFIAPYVPTETVLVFELLVINGSGMASFGGTGIRIEPSNYAGNHAPHLSAATDAAEVYEGWQVHLTASADDMPDGDTPIVDWNQLVGAGVTGTWTTNASSGIGYAMMDHTFFAPAGVFQQDHVLKFMVTAVDGKTGADFVPVTVVIRLMGDVSGDGFVDSTDETLVQSAMGAQSGDLNWNPWADLDRSGLITTADLQLVLDNIGRSLVP